MRGPLGGHMLWSSRRGSQRHQRLHQWSEGGSFGTFLCARWLLCFAARSALEIALQAADDLGAKIGDRIDVRESRRGREIFKTTAETMRSAQIPEWVSSDPSKLSGSVLAEPAREQMPLEFNEQLVVEYYSR